MIVLSFGFHYYFNSITVLKEQYVFEVVLKFCQPTTLQGLVMLCKDLLSSGWNISPDLNL